MRRMRRLAVTIAFTIGTLACSDLLPTGLGDGGGDVDVQVQISSQPTYSWTGGAAFDVQVIRVSQASIFAWRIADVNNRNIRSPVQHGSQPAGTTLLADNELSLTPGVLYRVTVTLADGQTKGFREFRP